MMWWIAGLFGVMLVLIFRAFPASGPRYAQSFYRWTRASLAWNLVGWVVILCSVAWFGEHQRQVVQQETAWMLQREETFHDLIRARLARLEKQAARKWWRR